MTQLPSPDSQPDLKQVNLPPQADIALLRILDANGNRAAEGLRVVEDFSRFALNDKHLAALCKQLRHELTQSLNLVPVEIRLIARDTLGDVGATITESAEQYRKDAWHVATASAARVQQALRCLEEYSKPLSVELATRFESMRYRVYVLQRSLGITVSSVNRLHDIRLYILLDGQSSEADLQDRVASLLRAGVRLFQLRDKTLDDRQLLRRARIMRETIDASNREKTRPALMIMNDRPDLAVLASADGVHVGQDELRVADVRAIVGPQRLIGVSTHSMEQARQAVLDGADYLGCGPTFPTATKEFASYPGLDFLAQVSQEISLPAFAIGGIHRQQLSAVLETGVSRIAVSGAIDQADCPRDEAATLLHLLEEIVEETE
ncbi:MAG: thiamine phosphate synthase [Pirellulaceae bacterium]